MDGFSKIEQQKRKQMVGSLFSLNNEKELIEKWKETVNYFKTDNQTAYTVKAIWEKLQFPEEYLRKIGE